MKVVSNTTAVTTRIKMGREDWLGLLFGSVLIPPAVAEELRAWHGAIPSCATFTP